MLKTAAAILGGNAVGTVCQFIGALLVARWVGPEDMGLWNAVGIVSVYAPYLSLGIFSGLGREYPLTVGKGDVAEARGFVSASYGVAVSLVAVTIPVFAAWAGHAFWMGRARLGVTIVATGVVVALWWLNAHLNTTYRTSREFTGRSVRSSVVSLASLILVVLAWKWGFGGFLLRAGVVAFLGVLALHFRRPVPVPPRLDRRRAIHLAKIGAPMMLVGQLAAFHMSLDRTVLLSRTEALGYLTLALQGGAAMRMLPTVFVQLTFPQMAQRLGQTGKGSDVWQIAVKGTAAAIALGAVAALAGWFAVPPFVEYVLPRYIPGIRAAQWSCLIALAWAPYVFANVFNVLRRQDLAILAFGAGAASFFGLFFLLPQGGSAQEQSVAAARAMVGSTLVYSLACIGLARIACSRFDRRAAEAPSPS